MPGLLIPDDWDEPTDGYCDMSLSVPNSPIWRANARGAIQALSLERAWDAQTGDTQQAALDGLNIFKSAAFECGNVQVPINIGNGYIEWAFDGSYRIHSTRLSGGWAWMWVSINDDGETYVDSNDYTITAIPEGYTPEGDPIEIYDRDFNVIDVQSELIDYCIADLGALWLISDVSEFWLNLTIGEVCP